MAMDDYIYWEMKVSSGLLYYYYYYYYYYYSTLYPISVDAIISSAVYKVDTITKFTVTAMDNKTKQNN